jgi:recombinational DNA repair protein (RecF pathway)
MAYQIYTTDAIVCGGKAMNIADRSHLLFTREAGMLFATARSVREERSRQRYALQDLSCVRVSLVKGKAGWRVGSVQGLGNYYFAATDRAARGSVISFARLLRRFVHGEVGDVHLYDTVTQSFRLLAGPLQSRSVVDRICSLRVLSHFGLCRCR